MIVTFFYYLITFVSYFYVFLLKVKGDKFDLRQLSDIIFIISFFIVSIPAPLVFNGTYFKDSSFYFGFNFEVFFIYMSFSILLPITCIFADLFYSNFINFEIVEKKKQSEVDCFFLMLLSLFTLYLIFTVGITNLPNVAVFTSSWYEIIKLKFLLSSDHYGLLVSKFPTLVFPVLLSLVIAFFSDKKNKLSLMLVCVLFVFYVTVNISRAALAYYVFCFICAYCFFTDKKFYLRYIFIIVAMLFLTFSLFGMPKDSVNISTILFNILNRLTGQHAFTYIQEIIYSQSSYPWYQKINLPGISYLFDIEFINISKEAYLLFYDNGLKGGTAGLSIAQLYFAFGFPGVFFWSILVFIFLIIDKILFESLISQKHRNNKTIHLMSFYYMLVGIYSTNLLTNIYSVYSFSMIFSVSFWYIIGMFFIRFSIVKKSI